MTSGMIVMTVAYGLYFMTSVEAISSLGRLIGRGAFISVIMVLFFLPMCLMIFDRFIVKPDHAERKHAKMNRIHAMKVKLPTLSALHELRSATQRDFARLFLPGEVTVLYGPVPWVRRLRTLLEMMRAAMPEQDYPGGLYLLLILHYVEQECLAESSAAARPRNETIEQVCAYLAANYRQKFSLTEVAARFYLSPYYLSRLFRRVTGQSIVDYLNNRRIEAAQKLLETTELSISAIAEQTGFASAAHFRRVFREVMDISPLQYRKKQTK